jgi:hypothetical protein
MSEGLTPAQWAKRRREELVRENVYLGGDEDAVIVGEEEDE